MYSRPEPNPLLEDFLDHICAPLVGVLPYLERQQLRDEVRDHVECLVEEAAGAGMDSDAALRSALDSFGEPWLVGEKLLKEVRTPEPGPVPVLRSALGHALVWFGLPSAACLWVITEGLVSTERHGLLLYAVLLALLVPCPAGILTGLTGRGDVDGGLVRAVLIVCAVSLGSGLLLLPHVEGLELALFQLLFWLPLGWVSARTTVFTRRQYRRSHFLRPERRLLPKGATR